jgi:hypothetical protein
VLRTAWTLAVLAMIAIAVGCETVEDPLPPQSALNVDITDSAIATQLSPLPSPQVVTWKVEELSASGITGFDGTYSFMHSGPCAYQLNVLAPVSFVNACRTSGLTLHPATHTAGATFRITLSRLEVRAAARPDLSSSGDPDGDGIPSSGDNCPIVPNPDQANVNAGDETLAAGDACSLDDSTGSPTVGDQDLDGLSDFVDNCLWYPNPLAPGDTDPADSNGDGIGDACERIAPVVIANGTVTIACDGVDFTTIPSAISFFRLDFGRPGVLTCDAGFTGCQLDPSKIRLSAVGSLATFPCHQVP